MMRTGPEASPRRAADPSGGRWTRPWIPIAVVVAIVGVFVGGLRLMVSQFRDRVREGFLQHDATILQAATAAERNAGTDDLDPKARLAAVLDAANLNTNVFGVRLFDENGKFLAALSKELKPTQLSAQQMDLINRGQFVSAFQPEMDVSQQFSPGLIATQIAPVTVAIVPVLSESGEVNGAAEFLLDGSRLKVQLQQVDRELNVYAVRSSILGGVFIAALLSWAFYRLNSANRLLAERTANLLKANHELTMAAKTSAIGAVAAHLIHGLKNPLFGLQAFVSIKSEEDEGGEWKLAIDSAKRMQTMIADVVRILREESGDSGYEVSLEELVGILESKLSPQARDAAVPLRISREAEGALPNREANLIILVLTNLIQNAVQASKAGAKITVKVLGDPDALVFEVSDEAGGLPGPMLQNLFTPCQSSKAGGTGLGLAISKQLANHMGGQLELVKSDSVGTTFRLTMPRRAFLSAPDKLEAAPA